MLSNSLTLSRMPKERPTSKSTSASNCLTFTKLARGHTSSVEVVKVVTKMAGAIDLAVEVIKEGREIQFTATDLVHLHMVEAVEEEDSKGTKTHPSLLAILTTPLTSLL